MSRHTPGPWVADDNEGFGVWSIWEEKSLTSSRKNGPNKVAEAIGDSAETQANADLIAAAPDLLTSIIALLAAVENPDNILSELIPERTAVKNAIAKATGGDA